MASTTAVEPGVGYQPQSSCSPKDMPGLVKLRRLVLKTYGQGGAGGISRGCTEGLSEHSEGRAWDWMADSRKSKERAAAADFISWATRDGGRNARRVGIMYIIYNEKIWAVYRANDGWRPSTGHKDHVHISMTWNGARGNTSFWTGKVQPVDFGPCVKFRGSYAARTSTPRLKPCPAPTALVKKTSLPNRQFGTTGSSVAAAQKLLKIKRTSRFDQATMNAVGAYQRAHDLPNTGALDQPTWASLRTSSVKSNAAAGYSRSKAAKTGLKKFSSSPVRRDDAGTSVLLLQTALGLPSRDRTGYFGKVTQAAVKKEQKRAGRPADGVVRAQEWKALAG